MHSPDDVARSVRRLIAEMLGPPWHLDLERKEVVDDARPAGVVEVGQQRTRQARTGIDQGAVNVFMPVTVTLYPELREPREAGRAARLLADDLHMLMLVGADGPTFADGRPASGPERVPLYDYTNVALVGTAAERRGPTHAHDVMWVEDYGANAIQDPLDAQRWTVVLDARLSFWRGGRVPPVAPVVASMPLTVNTIP